MRDAVAVELDELADDAVLAQHLGDGEDEVGRGRALGQLAVQPEAEDLRDEHRHRLAEHRRLGLDAADAPAQDAQAVDHRRVRVGPDQRVGVREAVARSTNTTRARYSRLTWWTMPVSGGTTAKLSKASWPQWLQISVRLRVCPFPGQSRRAQLVLAQPQLRLFRAKRALPSLLRHRKRIDIEQRKPARVLGLCGAHQPP